MTRRLLSVSALASLLLAALPTPSALARDEAERLWLVGERAFADGLQPLARRVLERFVAEYPNDARLPSAVLLLGRSRLALGDTESALEAFRRLSTLPPTPDPLEGKLWEAECLFRLKRFEEARDAYDEVIRKDAMSPRAPDALYGLASSERELRRLEPAVTAFRELLATWPEHPQAPSAAFYLASTLVALKRSTDALPLLASFPTKYPGHKLVPDAQYLLGRTRVTTGDRKEGLDGLRAFVAAYPSHDFVPAARRAINENAAFDLATEAFKRKDWRMAAAQAQTAAKSDDERLRAEALLLAGESELKLSRFQAAAKSFEAVGAVKNVEADVRYRALAGLGLAREELKDLRGALVAYESVASKSPDATLRDWARARATAVKGRLP